MILAAGLGTRLKPITDTIPKALVEIDGQPMLERVIVALKNQGFNKIVVNIHHFADQIEEFLKKKDFGIEIFVSDERDKLLDTGGGIVKAFPLLFKEDTDPVLIHNVDILSNAVLRELNLNTDGYAAVLLVNQRDSSRKLIFDENMHLVGWHDLEQDKFKPEGLINKDNYKELAFSGIYAMSKSGIMEMKKLKGEGKFSVMEYFLHPDRKLTIKGLEQPGLKVLDIGKPATMLQASAIFKNSENNSN